MSEGIYRVEFCEPNGVFRANGALPGALYLNGFHHVATAVAAAQREIERCSRYGWSAAAADHANYRVVRIADRAVVWRGGEKVPEPPKDEPKVEPKDEREEFWFCKAVNGLCNALGQVKTRDAEVLWPPEQPESLVARQGEPEPTEPGPCTDEPMPERERVGSCYILTGLRPDGERVLFVTRKMGEAFDEFRREVLIGSTELKLVQRDAFVEVV